MKRLAGLPAIGPTTMLGLNIAKTLDITSWFRIKPTTTTAAPAKQPEVVDTSSPYTSLDPAKLGLGKPLDACIQKNGAMEPFHTLFNQSLLTAGSVEPKNEGIASSMEPLQIPSVPHLECFGVGKEMQTPIAADCAHEGASKSSHSPTAPTNQQVSSSFKIPPSYLDEEDQMTPFSALFPHHLLSDTAEDIPNMSSDAAPLLEPSNLCEPGTQGIQMPFDHIFGINTTSTEAHDLGRLNAGTSSNEDGGRASPQPSTISRVHSEGLSDSLDSSRRSSWATSISTYREDCDNDDANNLDTESNPNMDKIALIHECDYYSELIDVGHPQNCRDREFVAPLPDPEGGNEVLMAELDSQSAGGPTIAVHQDVACDCPETSATHAAPDLPGERAQSEASTDSEMDRSPSTPGEAAAWAHSYCDADPESAKLKILKDERGREYVLYHDCFHCVPIELAPEFAHVVDDEDDGYGSATETSETAKDGTKLVTIPEEEDEG